MAKQQKVLLSLFVLAGAVLRLAWQAYSNELSPHPSQQVLAAVDVQEPTEGFSVLTNSQEPTDRQPEVYQGSFFYTTVEAMLQALKVRVFPEDRIYAFPDPQLGVGSEIKVYRAQPVLIKDAGNEHLVRSWSGTVEELVGEYGLNIGSKDVIEPGLSTVIPLGDQPLSLTITRVAESEIKVNEPIIYSTKIIDDATLERGVRTVEQAGRSGKLQRTFLVRRENGQEVWRKQIGQQVVQEPVTEVIRRGSKIIEYGAGKASWYGGVGAMTAAHLTLPMGTRVRVVNVSNGKSVSVRIADRGPFVPGRIIDLSADAFAELASTGSGVISVRVEKDY